jgi:hypothetical protein
MVGTAYPIFDLPGGFLNFSTDVTSVLSDISSNTDATVNRLDALLLEAGDIALATDATAASLVLIDATLDALEITLAAVALDTTATAANTALSAASLVVIENNTGVLITQNATELIVLNQIYAQLITLTTAAGLTNTSLNTINNSIIAGNVQQAAANATIIALLTTMNSNLNFLATTQNTALGFLNTIQANSSTTVSSLNSLVTSNSTIASLSSNLSQLSLLTNINTSSGDIDTILTNITGPVNPVGFFLPNYFINTHVTYVPPSGSTNVVAY